MIKFYVIVGLVVAATIGVIYYTYEQRSIGSVAERLKQEKANAEFRVKSNAGVVSYDTCDTAGGVYDFSKGTCKLH